jgi:hypothetical protein
MNHAINGSLLIPIFDTEKDIPQARDEQFDRGANTR